MARLDFTFSKHLGLANLMSLTHTMISFIFFLITVCRQLQVVSMEIAARVVVCRIVNIPTGGMSVAGRVGATTNTHH